MTPAAKGMGGAVKKAEDLAADLGDQGLPAPAVQQPRQPEGPPRDDGPGDLGRHGRRARHPARRRGHGGTLTGSAQYLKPLKPSLKVIAVEPTESPVLSGGSPGPHKIQGIGAGFVPGNADTSLIDEVVQISSEDAIAMARGLARKEGIFCGISSGAAVLAAKIVGERAENAGKRIVVIIPSFGGAPPVDAPLPEPLGRGERDEGRAVAPRAIKRASKQKRRLAFLSLGSTGTARERHVRGLQIAGARPLDATGGRSPFDAIPSGGVVGEGRGAAQNRR